MKNYFLGCAILLQTSIASAADLEIIGRDQWGAKPFRECSQDETAQLNEINRLRREERIAWCSLEDDKKSSALKKQLATMTEPNCLYPDPKPPEQLVLHHTEGNFTKRDGTPVTVLDVYNDHIYVNKWT